MATIQKSTKINFYKFVQVKEPSSSAVKSDDTVVLAKTINKNVEATNRLGSTLNSLASILSGIKAAQLAMLDAAQRKRVDFKADYTKVKKRKQESKFTLMDGFQTPSFLEGLFNFLSGLFKAAILIPALKWLSNPENREKVKTIVDIIGKVVKFIFDVAKFGVVNTIEGLYNLLKDDATWQERLLGFGQALVGIGTIVLGLRYLKNPTKIITDIAKSIKALINFATGGGGRRGGGGTPGGGRRRRRRRFNPLRRRSLGGPVPEAAQGGFISGPQSGYRVSLDGGRSTSFIGHGTEYVARKANGGAFVIPLNTPGTKTQPHLTQKRTQEAKSQGFDLGGMLQKSQGGFKPGKGYKNPMSKNVMPAFAPEAKFMSQGGNLDKQIYLHWTASGYNWKNGPYHTTVQGDGSLYKHLPYDQHTAHTYYRNTGNVGLSVAAMKDYNWNAFAPKPKQLESMMAEAANVAKTWGWKPSDVSIRNVMTHAECASNKDGRTPHDNYGPTWWGGTGERSDLHKLKGSDKDGTGGDKLRQMMKRFMGMQNPPILNEAGPGAGGDRNNNGQINSSEYNLLQRLVLAEAGGEGKLGMALVARSVLNRAGLIQSGKVGPGMFMANDESVTGVIMGRNQYQPVRDGSIDKPRTDEDMNAAKEAIELARNPAGLRGTLEAEGVASNNINYLMGATGFRTGSAFNDPSQNVNVVQYKNHFFNTAGNKGVKTMLAEIENGGTGGGPGAGDYGSNTGNRGSVDFSMDKSKAKTPLSEKAKSLIAQITGGKASSSTGLTIGGAPGALPASKFQATDQPSTELEKQTDERNKARRAITEKSQSMIQTALAAIAQQNGVNSQAVKAAQTAVQMAMEQSNNQPMMVGGGGSAPQKSIASSLSSSLNPLRGILK
jgi:spore germination cell wall hydrolase CwlJ-like protein|tara:strand:+ start:2097 stop:4763 length:2667 start_codon:yes stop_codon:yes gene_type:complete